MESMTPLLSKAAALSLILQPPALVQANDNGLGLTPPMGWRSWNAFGANVNQTLMQRVMDAMVSKKRVDRAGKPISVCDLGYCDVGLDDAWQDCGSNQSAPGFHYHDINGNPLVNLKRFPDMKAMTDYGHKLGLTVGWYGNNCICNDQCSRVNSTSEVDTCGKQITGDVNAFIKYGFDSWKLDGCGGETDLRLFNEVLQGQGKNVMVENCHWGSVRPFQPDRSLPPSEGCPWNMYRTSGDIYSSYGSVMENLDSVHHLQSANLSYPGCWAYPDMLMVGVKDGVHGKDDPGLNPAETRTHFGGWAIVSSPLVLGLDPTNDTIMDSVWPIISNKEVIAINQDYVGDSGGIFTHSEQKTTIPGSSYSTYDWQTLKKDLSGGRVAVLFINTLEDTEIELSVDFNSLAGLTGCDTMMDAESNTMMKKCNARDIWKQEDISGSLSNLTVTVDPHDALLYIVGGKGNFTRPSL